MLNNKTSKFRYCDFRRTQTIIKLKFLKNFKIPRQEIYETNYMHVWNKAVSLQTKNHAYGDVSLLWSNSLEK